MTTIPRAGCDDGDDIGDDSDLMIDD